MHFLFQLSLSHVCNRTNERTFFTSWFIMRSMLCASTTTVCLGKMLMQSHLTCYMVYQCLPTLEFLLSLWKPWKYLGINPAYSFSAYSSSPAKVQKHKGSRTMKRALQWQAHHKRWTINMRNGRARNSRKGPTQPIEPWRLECVLLKHGRSH